MTRKIIYLVVCLVLDIHVSAQESPYSFNWKRDLVYSAGSGIVAAGGIFAHFQVMPLTQAQLIGLDKYDVPGFDRSAISNWNPKADLASDIFLYGSVALPAIMMIDRRARKDFLLVGFMYAEVAMLTLGVTELTKGLARRPRPYAYNDQVGLDQRMSRDARMSFFSGHTSITTALCFTSAKIFSDYSDNPTHEALVWTGAVILPAITGYLRYDAGKHFPSDIIAGYAIGGIIGYMVPWLHRRKPMVKGLSWAPYSNGRQEVGIYVNYQL